MGFRFRKQVKILKGLKLNVSKKGPSSLSLGKKGATTNISKKGGLAHTIGIPGTGLSYRTDKSTPAWLLALVIIGILIILVFDIKIGP